MYGNNVFWAQRDTVFKAPADGNGPATAIRGFSESGISLKGIAVVDSSVQPQPPASQP